MTENTKDAPLKITPDFIIDLVLRRRWLIMVPVFMAIIVGIFLAVKLPKSYEAQTTILVESQRVPQDYVKSIVTEDTSQRISMISQQILSHTNLETIIKNFNLFSGPQYSQMFIEDKVASLRNRISVDVIADRRRVTEAFTISFKDKNPEKAMRVANGLAAYFIDQNLRDREDQATGTSDFLEAELEAMRKNLEKVEESIKEYRRSNMGELPEQLETNLRMLERLQSDLTGRQQSLREAKTRLAQLNSMATSREPSVVVIGAGRRDDDSGGQSLEAMKAQLESLQGRYTDKHPDIQRLKKQIEEYENRQSGDDDVPAGLPPALRQQILEAKNEIQIAENEIEALRNQITDYQKRTENIPKREQELLSLKRDYERIKTTYDSLLARKLEADIAVNMERKQKGEQFRVLDPARVPQRPVEPNLKKLFMIVVFFGFGLGGGTAFLLEIIKPTFRKPIDLEQEFEIPVLVSIPRLLQPKELMLKRLNEFASIAFSVLLLILFGLYGIISLKGPEITVETLKKIVGS